MQPHTLGMLIPIISIVMGCTIPIVYIISSFKRRKHLFALYHEERLAAISKGVDLPPLPEALLMDNPHSPTRRTPHDILRSGLIWLFVGIALFFALPALSHKQGVEMVGLIPGAVGLANLLYYALVGRHLKVEPPKNPETKVAQPV